MLPAGPGSAVAALVSRIVLVDVGLEHTLATAMIAQFGEVS